MLKPMLALLIGALTLGSPLAASGPDCGQCSNQFPFPSSYTTEEYCSANQLTLDIPDIIDDLAESIVAHISCPGCTAPATGCGRSVHHDGQFATYTLRDVGPTEECPWDPENNQFGATIAIIDLSGRSAWVCCGTCAQPL